MACTAAPDVWRVVRLRQQPQAAPPGDAAPVLPLRAQCSGAGVLQSPAAGGEQTLSRHMCDAPDCWD